MKYSFPRAVLLVALSFYLSGCVSAMLTKRIVQAPNQTDLPSPLRHAEVIAKDDRTYAQGWNVSVGPPAAQLAVAVIEPGNYDFKYAIEWKDRSNGGKYPVVHSDWTIPDRSVLPAASVKGTILLLHGFGDSKERVMHWALYLAEAGYRALLVDLRGHGRSTGNWVGYGAFETHDLMQVLDSAQSKGLISGKIGVLGVSYGGSVGLQLAARDPRVATVVAIEAFSDARQAVVEFSHVVAGKYVKDWTQSDFDRALSGAAKMANFSWSDTNVLAAVEHTSVPLLFYHGGRDNMISPEHSRILAKAAKGESKLRILETDGHIILSLRLEPIAQEVSAWFDRLVAVAPTPAAGPGGG